MFICFFQRAVSWKVPPDVIPGALHEGIQINTQCSYKVSLESNPHNGKSLVSTVYTVPGIYSVLTMATVLSTVSDIYGLEFNPHNCKRHVSTVYTVLSLHSQSPSLAMSRVFSPQCIQYQVFIAGIQTLQQQESCPQCIPCTSYAQLKSKHYNSKSLVSPSIIFQFSF